MDLLFHDVHPSLGSQVDGEMGGIWLDGRKMEDKEISRPR